MKELFGFGGFYLTTMALAHPPRDLCQHLRTLGRACVIWGGQLAMVWGQRGTLWGSYSGTLYQFTQWTVRHLIQRTGAELRSPCVS